MSDKPQKKFKLFQFAPSVEHPDYPGVYGWGFDSHGYRFVVYTPKEHDHPVVAQRIQELNEQAAAETHVEKVQGKDRKKERRPARRGEEHGPAHLHVFHIATGREMRFELLEHYARDQHTGRPFSMGGKHEMPLNQRDLEIVTPIVQSKAETFIQAWREAYIDSKLSGYVTRISNAGGEDIEEKIDSAGWLHSKDSRGRVAKSPPPNMDKTQDQIPTPEAHRSRDGHYHVRG